MTQRDPNALAVSSVRGPARKNGVGGSAQTDAPHGSLSQFEGADQDTYWEFVGNGKNTGTDVVDHAVAHEAEHGQEKLQPLVGDRQFAQEAAKKLLGSSDEPIPAGEVHTFSLKDLLGMVEPFMRAYASQQKQQQQAADAASANDQDRVIGKVNSQGLSLPWFDL